MEIDTEILIHSTSFFSKNKERGGRTLAHIDSPLKVMYECVNKFEKKVVLAEDSTLSASLVITVYRLGNLEGLCLNLLK